MAYRFYIFKEKTIITILRIIIFLLTLGTIFLSYKMQTKYYLPIIIADGVLLLFYVLISRTISSSTNNAIKIKGSFILDSENNGYMVIPTVRVYLISIIFTTIITLLILFGPIDLKEVLSSINKYPGFLVLIIFLIFCNLLFFNGFIANIILKYKKNKIFDSLANGTKNSMIKGISNLTVTENNEIIGIYANQQVVLLFDESSSEYRNLINSMAQNYNNKVETYSREDVYGN